MFPFSDSSQSGMFDVTIFFIATQVRTLVIGCAIVPFHEVILDFAGAVGSGSSELAKSPASQLLG
jgi:hypothetical protein